MNEISYSDFDLLIERAGENSYRVRVLSSPAGQAVQEINLPFSEMEIENFILKVGRTRRGVRRLDSPEMESAKKFGSKLFKSIFQEDLMSTLRGSLDEAQKQKQGLRIRLRLNDVPELVNLPWEYLYNPSLNRFLSLSVNTPLVRYLELPERIKPLEITLPLKMLVMISSPKDYPGLDVEQEWRNLKSALVDLERRGLLEITRMDNATPQELQSRLRCDQFHIFHFIGHGGYNQQSQDGVLMFEEDNGNGRPLNGQYLGTLLHDESSLRLAVLNACEGGRSGPSDPFSGVAQSLVQQGLPAVIGMQFEVTDQAAITFAREFYTAIADNYPVDAAMAEARKAIFALGNDIEWGTPVLYMRSPDGKIFDINAISEAAAAEEAPEFRGGQPAVLPPAEAVSAGQPQPVPTMQPQPQERFDPIPAPRLEESQAIRSAPPAHTAVDVHSPPVSKKQALPFSLNQRSRLLFTMLGAGLGVVVILLGVMLVIRGATPLQPVPPAASPTSTMVASFTPDSNTLTGGSLVSGSQNQTKTSTPTRTPAATDTPLPSATKVSSATPTDTPAPLEKTFGFSQDAPEDSLQDTFLSQVNPNSVYGAEKVLLVDGDDPKTSGLDKGALIRWDLSSIPPGSQILGVRIQLYILNKSDIPYPVYAMLRDWNEKEANWKSASQETQWGYPGASAFTDRDGVPIGEIAAKSKLEKYEFELNPSGVAKVQSWIDDPAANFGIYIGDPDIEDGIDIASKESDDPANRPSITIIYLPAKQTGD